MIQTSDNFTYDMGKHRYILTAQGLINLRNLDLAKELNLVDEMDLARELDKISRNIYAYTYSRVGRIIPDKYSYRDKMEYLIFNNQHNEVEAIIEAMCDQAEYVAQSGGDAMANNWELDGVLLSPMDRLALLVSPVAVLTLETYGLNQGYALGFVLNDDEYRVGY